MYGPPLSTPEEPRPDSLRMYDVTAIGGKGLWEHPLDWYRAEGYDYLIASSFIYNIPLQDKQSNAERVAFYESLDDELQLVYEIYARDNKNTAFIFDEIYGPAIHLGERQRPGPTIKIYALGG
jgi:hypothetical protein